MKKTEGQPRSVSEYIARFPGPTRAVLQKVRKAIKAAAPDAEERISWTMPAYKLNGYVVFFAGYKNHVGFYPVTSGIRAFKEELKPYKTGKGSIQFPLDQPIPYGLIGKITRFRAAENRKAGK